MNSYGLCGARLCAGAHSQSVLPYLPGSTEVSVAAAEHPCLLAFADKFTRWDSEFASIYVLRWTFRESMAPSSVPRLCRVWRFWPI